MQPVRYATRPQIRGKSVSIPFPFDPDALWGRKERHDSCGTVNGVPVRGPLERDRDGWVLARGPAFWRDLGVDPASGPELEVVLGPEGPLLDEQDADVRAAFAGSAEATAFFYAIAPFYRKNWLRWIGDAKRPETRAARIAQTVEALAAGRRDR